jgi:hypothetical protein
VIKITVDLTDLASLTALPDQIKSVLDSVGQTLATQAYAHAVEQANQKLHTRREPYIQALSIGQDGDAWLLVLDASADWIEDGQEPHSLKEALLNSPKAKQGKNGKYLVVPFQHNKPEAKSTLTQTVANAMSQKGIPFADIEKGQDGQPKTGLLHKFDIMNAPTKTANSPGQGHGPIGAPMQGNTGIPFLKGVRVYQRQKQDAAGKFKTERFVATFRTVSEHGKSTWDHPGIEGSHILDETYQWVQDQWDREWSGRVMDQISDRLK